MPYSFRALLESSGTTFTVAEFPSGAVLFRQGDECSDALCIETGRVRLAVTSVDGREAVFGVLGAGSVMGEEVLSGRRDFRYSAVAIEPTVVLCVPDDQMERFRAQPECQDYLLVQALQRQIELEEALIHQLMDRAEKRLVYTLLVLAQCDGVIRRCALPHLSQEVLAEMVGTTRSRVNLFMNRFKKAGFLEARDGRTYVNPARLSPAMYRGLAQKNAPAARAC